METTLAHDLQGCNGEVLPSLAAFAPAMPEQVGRAIHELFENAMSHRLRHPRIQLREGVDVVVIKRAGQRSKYCGQILITGGGGWPSTWYGRIDESGVLYPGRALRENPAVHELLTEFASDPVGTAIKQGRLYGNCIFCRRRLSDPRSTAHGHGPVCAQNNGLAWCAPRNTRGLFGNVWNHVYGVPAEAP